MPNSMKRWGDFAPNSGFILCPNKEIGVETADIETVLHRGHKKQVRRVRFMRRYIREFSSALEEVGIQNIYS